jgi:hypothetical protein
MTIKTLLNIILKVFGLFFIKDILISIQQLFLLFIMQGTEYQSSTLVFKEAIMMVGMTLIYILVAYRLIFKSDTLIEKLHLARGIDQDTIALNTHRSTILSISIIVIGGYMVVNEIPYLGRQLFTYYQQKNAYEQTTFSSSYIILAGTEIIIGLLLIGLQRPIVNLIERQRKK